MSWPLGRGNTADLVVCLVCAVLLAWAIWAYLKDR